MEDRKAEERNIEKRFWKVPLQRVRVNALSGRGRILDIGGGGEGILGLLHGDRVVAIDPSREELEETDNPSLKIVMDGRNLLFVEESFSVVTLFYTLMYIAREDHGKVFSEAFRVLEAGGELRIWDTVIGSDYPEEKDILLVPVEAALPCRVVKTSYGVLWRNRAVTLSDYQALAQETGFQINAAEQKGDALSLILVKPKGEEKL